MTAGRNIHGEARPGGWAAPTLSIGVHALALSLLLVWPVAFPAPPPETPPLLVTLVTLAEEEPAEVPLAEPVPPPDPPAPEAPPAPPVVERAASPVPPPPPRRTTPKAKVPVVAAAPAPPATSEAVSRPSPPPPVAQAAPLAAEEPIVRPAPVNSPRPRYPRTARQRGLEGTVVVTVQVSEAGEVVDAAVRTSSGHAMLDQAAMDGVLRWRFSPARRQGEPTRATIDVPIRFELSAG